MRRRWLAPAVAALWLSGCMRVQLPAARIVSGLPPEELTWQRAVQLALAHHPDVLKARAELESKAHARNAALGGYLPTVGGSASWAHARSTGTQPGADALALGVDASQPLFTGFKTTAEFLSAKRQWEASRWAYRETSAAVRQRLRAAFVDTLRLEQLLEVNRRIATRRQDNADLIQLRYDAGREHRGSLLRAQAIAAEAAFNVRQTERRLGSQHLTFGRELGGQFQLTLQLAGDLEQLLPEPMDAPADYAGLAERTPTVERLIASAEALKADILGAQAALWPTVKGTANYGYSGEHASSLRDSASVGVAVSLPLFAGGRNVQGLLGARQDYRAAVEAARSARDAQIAALSEAWAALRDAREFVDVKRRFLEASRERADIVRTQYTSGLATFQDFDIAEDELVTAETAYVNSLADVLTQAAAWDAANGATLEEAAHVQ